MVEMFDLIEEHVESFIKPFTVCGKKEIGSVEMKRRIPSAINFETLFLIMFHKLYLYIMGIN